MKLLLALVVAFVFVSSIASSYAQIGQNNISIYVQVKVENSDGALVAYLETDKVTVTDYAKLSSLLDTNSPILHKKIVSTGNQKYELIKATAVQVYPSDTIVSLNLISAQQDNTPDKLLAYADHDGYPVVKGDKATAYWTILRPVS
ncbi:MAG TPA: hypothetical protein VFU58_06095 [Candidatus Nitrosotalea sp.]|nr:hypothetical protein [Candidatus Nitrosotalea sp.]